jgi:16S rRNA (uracil1498-N3)-methyltransferase
MRISRLLLERSLEIGHELVLDADLAHYARNVLRIKSGQQLRLFDGTTPVDYDARVTLDDKQVRLRIEASIAKKTDPDLDVWVVQGLGRSEHNDFVVQKSCELGASQIVFFNAQHTQAPLKAGRIDRKLTHWKGIARAACAQSNRNRLPRVSWVGSLREHLESSTNNIRGGVVLTFDARPIAEACQSLDPARSCSLIIGPEGGLSKSELELALDHGYLAASLGPRVLRMETAALSGLTLLQHYLGDLV